MKTYPPIWVDTTNRAVETILPGNGWKASSIPDWSALLRQARLINLAVSTQMRGMGWRTPTTIIVEYKPENSASLGSHDILVVCHGSQTTTTNTSSAVLTTNWLETQH